MFHRLSAPPEPPDDVARLLRAAPNTLCQTAPMSDACFTDRERAGIAWREAGPSSSPTVVFLHGLGGSRTAWDSTMSILADRFRCAAWDLPGYGESAPIESLTFESISTAIAGFLDRLDIQRAHVVGLSFGGQQAMHFAARHSDRIDRLVVADASARFGADGTDVDEWKRVRLDALDRGLSPADIAPMVVDSITGPGFGEPERTRAIEAFGRIPSDGLRAAVHCLPTLDLREDLTAIRAPTLLIVGELDTETPRSYSEYLLDAIAHARLEVIPGVGHLTPSEAPAEFSRLVGNHLAAVPDP